MSHQKFLFAVSVALILISGLLLYSQSPASPSAMPIGKPVATNAPLGLPPVPIPADNPPTPETIALGRRLYYDPLLSSDKSVSCATCHSPQYGFADPKPFSEGVDKKKGGRNSPPVLNAAYFHVQFWDGRAPSLEKQAEGPVQNPVEMANTLTEVERRLNDDPSYKEQFAKAWIVGRDNDLPTSLDPAEQIEARAVGEVEVQEADARMNGAEGFPGFAHGADGEGVVAAVFEEVAEALTQRGVVFNQEDGAGFGRGRHGVGRRRSNHNRSIARQIPESRGHTGRH